MRSLIETTGFIVHDSPDEPVCDLDRAHAWFRDLDADPQFDFDGQSLSTGEHARVERLKNPVERWRFAARCHFVRHVLGRLTGTAPASLKFCIGERGKPRLVFPIVTQDDRYAVLDFNLSHSENVLALAVAFDRNVGIDIEIVKPNVDVLAVARTQFAGEEVERLYGLDADKVAAAVHRLWTHREAVAKQDGGGLAWRQSIRPLTESGRKVHSFEFRLGENEIVGALALGEPYGGGQAAWAMAG